MARSITSTRASLQKQRSRTKVRLNVEALERRNLMAGEFLQGTSFIDTGSQPGVLDAGDTYLSGATIELRSTANGPAIATTSTGPQGQYRFDASNSTLVAGQTYYLVELPPSGYVNAGTQAFSHINGTTSSIGLNTIVAEVKPTSMWVEYEGSLDPRNAEFTFAPTAFPPDTFPTDFGRMRADLGPTSGSNGYSNDFLTFCIDLDHGVAENDTFEVLATPLANLPVTVGAGPTVTPNAAHNGNVGRIAYLFNHYAEDLTLNADQRAGMQLAIWEMLYDGDIDYPLDLETGDFIVHLDSTDPAVVAANAFMAESAGEYEQAVFLDSTLGGTYNEFLGHQSMLARSSLNFANVPSNSLSGYVYYDSNNNGMRSDEPALTAPISGVTVKLSGPVTATTITVNGYYEFKDLPAGTYTISEAQPSGYLDGRDTVGTPSGVVGGMAPTYDVFSEIELTSGQHGTEYNFGELKPANVTGSVYEDLNGSGIRNLGEPGIAGVTVTLSGTNDRTSVSLTTVTGANGDYFFGDLRPGSYTLTETQPMTGYSDGKDTPDNFNVIPGSATTDAIELPPLASGQTDDENNFGEVRILSSLSGYVYQDTNNNGVKEGTELGIYCVTITLSGTSDLGQSVFKTVNTNSSGLYQFTNLRPGTYKITETQPSGYYDGKDTIGTQLGNSAVNDVFSMIGLDPGEHGINNNFGEIPAAYVHQKQTGTIGFWANSNGQALLKALNGSSSAKNLGNWMAATYPNLYGKTAGANNLTGKTNLQIASIFVTKFNMSDKLEAQLMAVTFAAYVTKSSLAGTVAVGYGFEVTTNGTGAAKYYVGTSAPVFGYSSSITVLTVNEILKGANGKARNGRLWDTDGNGIINATEQGQRNLAYVIFEGINNQGDRL